jgi:hypothetical protein
LNGIIIMNIHRNLVATTDEIIDTLAFNTRHMKLFKKFNFCFLLIIIH